MQSFMRAFTAILVTLFLYSQPSSFGQTNDTFPLSAEATEVLQFSQQKMQQMLAKQENGTKERIVSDGVDRQTIIVVGGIPRHVQVVSAATLGVVRHYSPHVKLIAASQGLLSGTRPYIEPTDVRRKQYDDLTGPMFTTTTFPAEDLLMGLDKDSPYIDFYLHPDTPVLKVAEGNYLIPLQQRYPEWIRSAYLEFKQTGQLSMESLKPIFQRIDEDGGLRGMDMIPISIVHCQGC